MTGESDGVARPARALVILAMLSAGLAGCVPSNDPAAVLPQQTLRIGFGLTSGSGNQAGLRQVVTTISTEGLLHFGWDGRPLARLAESWHLSPDGLTLRVRLHPNASFHDGSPATAPILRDILAAELPEYMGSAFEDVRAIHAASDGELVFELTRRSTFLLESLDGGLRSPKDRSAGTGPFRLAQQEAGGAEMVRYEAYYRGAPLLNHVVLRPYTSVRSAWADMLRGEVDMLYEVGVDAIDFMQPTSAVRVFSVPRPYVTALIFNMRRPAFTDAAFRRALNSAIDRDVLVADALNGYGTPAVSPVWPLNWAYDATAPHFTYAPEVVSSEPPGRPHFTVLYTEPSHERLALMLQRQLRAVGVEIAFERAALDEAFARVSSGNFDAWLVDANGGPTMVRAYWFWYSGENFNYGKFSSAQVDRALDAVRLAPDDASYRAAVAAFQRALVEDPPALFLAWGERARAVSTRFEVPDEQGRDIFPATLRLWRPAAGNATVPSN